MNEPDTAGGFIAKWRARWPEWDVAEAFVAADKRAVAGAWFALLQELYDAAWAGEDPTPGLAKLAWWHEELEGWSKGARRHPLGEVLQRLPAPWTRLARALNALPSTRGQSAAEAAPSLSDLAEAVLECEAALFSIHGTANGASDAAAVLLGERVLITGGPTDGAWVIAHWPRLRGASRPRRLHAALLRRRLETLPEDGKAVPLRGWRVLLASWRAARVG